MTCNLYFSVDIETDGDAPGTNSMLSIGAVALNPRTYASENTFYKTLKRLPDARPQTSTMEWWDQFPQAWAETRRDPADPKQAMTDFRDFVLREVARVYRENEELQEAPTPVFVASPVSFDFSFVYYYFYRFLGECPFGFSALDLKSYCAALLNRPFTESKKDNYLPEWVSKLPHTHNALEDALQQADVLRKVLQWREKMVFVPAPEVR